MTRHDGDPSVEEVLDRLCETSGGKQYVTIGELLEGVGQRGFGVFLLAPALVELSPVGGIPGMATSLAAFVFLVCIQLLIGRSHLWFPFFIGRRRFTSERIQGAVQKLRPAARFLDRWFHGRIRALTSGPAVRMAAAAGILLCLTIPPLEFIPFASSAPMGAIAAFGLALVVQDGMLFVLAWAGSAAAFAVGPGLFVFGN